MTTTLDLGPTLYLTHAEYADMIRLLQLCEAVEQNWHRWRDQDETDECWGRVRLVRRRAGAMPGEEVAMVLWKPAAPKRALFDCRR